MIGKYLFLGLILLVVACQADVSLEGSTQQIDDSGNEAPEWALVIHGGAGTILKSNMTPEREAAYRSALDSALNIGAAILDNGGASLDAVEAVIRYLEDVPLFNAGKGAVFTHEGINELDASIMDGRDLNAGAVAGVKNIKHPISAARAVMEHSDHVLLAGNGAQDFAWEQGLDSVPESYFYTDSRYRSLQRALDKEKSDKHGTVGACALDRSGNLAAATSTGGMTNKRWNRIGDSPIIGAGTYANNATCAISCTGHGEYFIRHAVAHSVSAAMEYGGMTLEGAANHLIHEKLNPEAGSGGLIGVDKDGNIVMPFNTPGMYRGYALPGEQEVQIYQ